MAETKKNSTRYNYTTVRIPGIRVHRCSSTSTYPRKRYATRRAVRYIHTYIPYHLQERNNELMKFIRAKRVNSTVLLYVYTSTPPQPYQSVPKETRRHHLAGRGDAGQDAAAAMALVGDYHAQITGSDFRQGRHRLGPQGGLYGASPTGSLPSAVPLAITPTFRPCTHTSDDSYIYQLSLVLATATVSFIFF